MRSVRRFGVVDLLDYTAKNTSEKIPQRPNPRARQRHSREVHDHTVCRPALRAADLNVIAEATGSATLSIGPDGSEMAVQRNRAPAILQQILLLRRVIQRDTGAVVIECMALMPEYQKVSERRMLRTTHGIIANIRRDHLEQLGHNLEEIAHILASYATEQRCALDFSKIVRTNATISSTLWLKPIVERLWRYPTVVTKKNSTALVHRPKVLEAAAFFAYLLALILPLVIVQIFDRVIPNQAYETLAVLLVVLLAATLGEALLRTAGSTIAADTSASFEVDAIDRLAFLTLFRRNKASTPHDPVEMLEHFETVQKLRSLAVSDARQSRLSIPFTVVFGACFALIAPQLLWVLILAFGVIYLTQRGLDKVDEASKRRAEQSKRNAAFFSEAFESLETIKGMRAEPFLARRHEALALGAANAREASSRARGMRRALTETTTSAVPVVMAVVGAWAVMQNQLSAGALAAAILLSGRVIQPLLRSQSSTESHFALRSAENSLSELLKQPLPDPSVKSVSHFGTLSTSKVNVTNAEGQRLLDDVSFEISAGETIALTGATGSGKSILLQVLTGRLPTTEGKVCWNNEDISGLDPNALGRRMQLLRPNARIPETTAIELLTNGEPDRIPEVLRICAELGLDQAFSEHPQGMNARLGRSQGHNFPGSVVRRLHIVRALALEPDLILFDDANVGLDRDSDGLLLEYLKKRKGDFTLVLASARPSYLRLADRTFKMQGGRMFIAPRNDRPNRVEQSA